MNRTLVLTKLGNQPRVRPYPECQGTKLTVGDILLALFPGFGVDGIRDHQRRCHCSVTQVLLTSRGWNRVGVKPSMLQHLLIISNIILV